MSLLTSEEDRSSEAKSFALRRKEMVERNIAARGVRDELVLEAMRKVPRELFLPKNLREFAYEDSPLPIAGEQTISQPYIVAFMAEALMLKGGEKVLEIGAGSGYAAAVLSEIAANVYTVERLGQLADKAAATLADLGYDNVHVLHGDGTRGWPEHAPYDAIVVAAGGPQVPESLKEQLKIGGRLVIPVGADQRSQELVRVTRVSAREYRSEDIADVRFVPLIGEEGWATPKEGKGTRRRRPRCGRWCPTRKRWSGNSPTRLNRSRRLRPPISTRYWSASDRRASCCSAKRPTELRNSTGCANASPASSSSRRAFVWLPSRRTGRMRRASIIMCGISSIHHPSGPRSHGSRPGCGETPRCAISLAGCASTTARWRRASASRFTVLIFTASMIRSDRS